MKINRGAAEMSDAGEGGGNAKAFVEKWIARIEKSVLTWQ